MTHFGNDMTSFVTSPSAQGEPLDDEPPSLATAICIDTRDGPGRRRLFGVTQYAQRRGWRTMLIRRHGREAAQEVARLRPDGVIAFVADRWLVEVASRLAIPLVDTALDEVEVPLLVCLDDEAAGRLAAEHLMGLRLEHFAYCGVRGPRASTNRCESFAACLAGHGHSLHTFAQRIVEGESHMEPLIRWLRGLPKPVGLLACDDRLGERVLTACRWAKLPVPSQVAVLAVGNDELMCEVSNPSLSSVSYPIHRLGYQAAEMLDLAMSGLPIPASCIKISPIGVEVRRSTDMLAIQDTLVKAAVQLIRKRAGELIGVKHVARGLGVSRSTLDRRFAEVLGRTVHEELVAARMRIARNLLTDGLTPISEIAQTCGYSTAASFSRAFRDYVGCWPTDFRNGVRIV